MLILAFETSAKAASAALLEDGKLLAESYQNTGLTHSQTLMVMAENLLHQCGKTVNDVNAVAVAAGPGSFTGIRIGVAAAKGLALALDKAMTELPERVERVRSLNARLRTELANYPKVRINSPEAAVPQILNLSVKDVKGTVFQRELDAHGVCVSVKSACSSDGLPSRAVFAVSRDRRNALSSWRISLSHRTTDEEITGFLQAFDACYRTLTQP